MMPLRLAGFFALAYAISWLIWIPLWGPALGIAGLPVLPYHHALGAFGPMIAAFVMVAREKGGAGIAGLLRAMFIPPRRWLAVLVALFAPFVIVVGGAIVVDIMQGTPIELSGVGRTAEYPEFGIVAFTLFNLFTFGFGEETGWRGYALPRLQSRYSALVATAILTVFWALWHLPLFAYRPGYTGMDLAAIGGWFLSIFTGAVLLSWLFNWTRGSILVVAIFHATIDVAFTSDLSPLVVTTTGIAVTVWGLLVVLLAGPRNLARNERMVA